MSRHAVAGPARRWMRSKLLLADLSQSMARVSPSRFLRFMFFSSVADGNAPEQTDGRACVHVRVVLDLLDDLVLARRHLDGGVLLVLQLSGLGHVEEAVCALLVAEEADRGLLDRMLVAGDLAVGEHDLTAITRDLDEVVGQRLDADEQNITLAIHGPLLLRRP